MAAAPWHRAAYGAVPWTSAAAMGVATGYNEVQDALQQFFMHYRIASLEDQMQYQNAVDNLWRQFGRYENAGPRLAAGIIRLTYLENGVQQLQANMYWPTQLWQLLYEDAYR